MFCCLFESFDWDIVVILTLQCPAVVVVVKTTEIGYVLPLADVIIG